MKRIFKTFGTTLLVIMLLSVTYTVKALDKNFFVEEIEAPLEMEDWMIDDFIWAAQEDVKKGTPMLAITPEGDTVQVYIEDVVKVKDTTIVNQYNTYNTYNTYRDYDGWMFYYNNSWILSSLWYHNYYHVYYPIVHRHIYHSPNQIKNYYKKHNVTIINPKVIKERRVYTRPHNNPYRSKFNNGDYERRRNDSRFRNNVYTKPSNPRINNAPRRTTSTPQIKTNRPHSSNPINRSNTQQRQGRR